MLSDYILMSLKNLKGRKLRSWLTMIGIFIGIAAVVSLISLGEGLEQVVIGQFNIVGADILQVQASGVQFGPPGSGAVTPLTTDNLEAIKRVSGVKNAIGRLIVSGTAEYNNEAAIEFVASIPKDVDENVIYDLVSAKVEEGRLLRNDDHGKVMLGANFKDPDIFGKPVYVGSNILIEDQSFEVVGILKKKGSFVFDNVIMMTEDDVISLFEENRDTYDIIVVEGKDGVDIEELKLDVEKALRKDRDVDEGEEDFSVETNKAAIESLQSTLFGVQLFVYIIAAISLIVGGIGITNTMYTSVLERKRDIGIMKAIGARNSTIFFLFFVESGMFGSVGGIIGITLGVLFAKGIALAGQIALGTDLITAHITAPLIIGSLLFSFIIGTISGITPAMKAAKLNPVDALRG